MFRILTRLAAAAALLLLGAAAAAQAAEQRDWLEVPFQEITETARGSEVRWYMFGGWAHVNAWVDSYVAREMEERYGIDVVRVPMDASIFVNKLLNEKAAGKETGSIDLLWINGENFKNAKEAELLYGPFASRLPNARRYVDPGIARHDFGYPVEGFEAPFGRAQFVFEHDTARTPDPPRSFAALKRWVQTHPGRFTYPQPPDFTGSAFLRQVFYAVTGGHEHYMDGFDAKLYAEQAPKLWSYLNAIEPFLWQEGRTYPKDSASLDTLFARGEVDLGMSYHPPHAQNKILEGTYPDTVRTFTMDSGSLANTHFTAIPFNAPHKPAAMVLANFLLSVDAQLSKYHPENWGDFPALDMARLSPEDRERFASVDLGPATLPPAELQPEAVPEIPTEYLERLEEDWEDEVLRK